MKKGSIALIFSLFAISSNSCIKEKWIPLFNGKDLTGWDIKIKGSPLNVNYKNTFRAETEC